MLMKEMRWLLLTCGSFVLTSAVVGNAFYQKHQFYPSVVYITKSNPSMAVLYLQAFVFVILMGKLFRKIFFGQLRAAEMEHLIERSWYAVTETCLAFTVFRDDFSPKFVASFTLLLFLKCFHWLAEDRVDYMERSTNISVLFHMRVISLLTFLSLVDSYFVNLAYYSTITKGPSVQLVFGFEYAILITIVMMAVMKYVLHSVDLQSENPWENKAVYLLYSELILGFLKVILYIVFVLIMVKIHTFPLFAIRPMYLSIRNFKKSLHDVVMSRRAIRRMNTLYPDVTPEELQSGDNVCIICREDMVTGCKRLPCNHIFHTTCLRSWFQRQQSCPTCRMDLFQQPVRPQAPPPPQQAAHQQPFQNFFGGAFPQVPPMWPPQVPPHMPPPQQPEAMPQQTQGTTGTTQAPPSTSQATPTTSTQAGSSAQAPPTSTQVPPTAAPGPIPTMPAGMAMPQMSPFMPMFPPMFPPMTQGFPRPPSNLSGLSEEELRTMEGTERANIEARIEWLRDIQALLDGAMLLMQQYNIVAANSSVPGINVNVRSSSPAASNTFTSQTNTGADSGARPKYSTTATTVGATSIPKTDSNEQNTETDDTEGATGFTPPTTEYIPEWSGLNKEEHKDEMDEVRRRRLEKFLSDTSHNSNKSTEDQSS